jgi:peptide/nickel transport system permease protein
MGRFIGIRLLHALIILALVTVLTFVIAQLVPGDGILAAMSTSIDMSDASVVARVRQQYGLDQPIPVQFVDWLSRFVAGDWGTSIGAGEKVREMFMRACRRRSSCSSARPCGRSRSASRPASSPRLKRNSGST